MNLSITTFQYFSSDGFTYLGPPPDVELPVPPPCELLGLCSRVKWAEKSDVT